MDSPAGTTASRTTSPSDEISSDIETVAANSVAVGTWTIFARVTGLLRVAAIAAVLGPTFFGNLFQATNAIPNLLYEFVAGNLIVSLLVPRLVLRKDSGDHSAVARTAGQFLAVLLSLFLVIIVITVAARPIVLSFLSFAVDDAAVREQQQSTGLLLLALFIPQVLFYAVAGIGMAVQHAYGKYRLATAAYSVENLWVMLVVILSGVMFGAGVAIDEVTTPQLVFLGVGTTGAVVLHAAVQWWGAWRVGVPLRPRLGWRANEDLLHVLRLGLPSVGHAAMNAARIITMIAVAGSLPGGVVAFQIALAFLALPLAIGARPVAWAMVPHLSRLHEAGQWPSFQRDWAKGLSMSIFIVVPALAGYVALASPLASVVSVGEMAAGAALVSAALIPLAAAIPGATLFIHGSHGSYAHSDARSPLIAMAVRAGLTIAGLFVVAELTEGQSLLVGMGLTIAVADLLSGSLLGVRILRGSVRAVRPIAAALARATAAAIVMGIPVYFLGSWGAAGAGGQAEVAMWVFAAIGVGMLVYFAMQRWALAAPEYQLLASQFGGLFRRTAS